VQLLLHLERHSMLPDQLGLRSMQVRVHQGWLLYQLLERRQGLLCDDSSLLQLPVAMLRERLRLLHLLQQHAGLLRHLRLIEVVRFETKSPGQLTAMPANPPRGFLFK
jgi:hypothetical protein